jgi:hypothetical protein
MARFIRTAIGYNDPIELSWRVMANTTINEGDLVEVDGTTKYLKPAVAGDTTYAGIAQQSIVTGATVTVDDAISIIPLTDVVFRIPFDTSGAKKTFADTDLANVKFALKTANSIDPNVTTGAFTLLDYNNTKLYADVICADDHIVKLS